MPSSPTSTSRAPCSDILDSTAPMQPLDRRSYLFANRRAQDCVASIKTFGGDRPARDLIGAQQLARCGSERAKAEPRQFIPGKVAIAPVGTFRSDRLGVKIGRENAQHAVNVREVRAMLIKLALQLIDDASQLAPLLDQAGNEIILVGDHDAVQTGLFWPAGVALITAVQFPPFGLRRLSSRHAASFCVLDRADLQSRFALIR
jgi:hypothetical protein